MGRIKGDDRSRHGVFAGPEPTCYGPASCRLFWGVRAVAPVPALCIASRVHEFIGDLHRHPSQVRSPRDPLDWLDYRGKKESGSVKPRHPDFKLRNGGRESMGQV